MPKHNALIIGDHIVQDGEMTYTLEFCVTLGIELNEKLNYHWSHPCEELHLFVLYKCYKLGKKMIEGTVTTR